jgi:hypothetical protein
MIKLPEIGIHYLDPATFADDKFIEIAKQTL